MPRRKQTRRRRQWTPRPSVWPYEPPDELDEFLGALDVEDELDELEMLFGDQPEPSRPEYRPVRSRRGDFIGSPLARAWADRAGDCGAGVARLARGLDYLNFCIIFLKPLFCTIFSSKLMLLIDS